MAGPPTAIPLSAKRRWPIAHTSGVRETRVSLESVMLEDDPSILESLAGMLVQFELGFEIMPSTGTAHVSPELYTIAAEPLDQAYCDACTSLCDSKALKRVNQVGAPP
jgi:hypothetical protein